jgi:hypothetical protein
MLPVGGVWGNDRLGVSSARRAGASSTLADAQKGG